MKGVSSNKYILSIKGGQEESGVGFLAGTGYLYLS